MSHYRLEGVRLTLHVFKDRHACLAPVFKHDMMYQLIFQVAEEALGNGAVEAVALAAHALDYAIVL